MLLSSRMPDLQMRRRPARLLLVAINAHHRNDIDATERTLAIAAADMPSNVKSLNLYIPIPDKRITRSIAHLLGTNSVLCLSPESPACKDIHKARHNVDEILAQNLGAQKCGGPLDTNP